MDTIKDLLTAGTAIGRQQAFAVIAAKCSAAQALTIKQIKESGSYEALGLTWQDFCPEFFGISQVTADRIIKQLTELGQAYFRLGQLARITETEFRQIASQVTTEAIEFEGESIPLTPENAPRIRQAVRALRQELRNVQSAFAARSDTVSQLQTRLDALIADMKRLDRPLLPATDRQSLRGLAHYAIDKWSDVARAYDKAA
jgi:uncharacterized membrane protein